MSIDLASFTSAALLAQATQPPVPGAHATEGTGNTQAVQGAPPATGPSGGGTPTGNPFGSMWILLLGMIVLMFVMTSMSGKKQEKQRKALLAAAKRNDRVQTVGGIIGTIIDLTDTEMVLRVDEPSNTRIRFARSALQQVLREGKEPARTELEAKSRSEAATVK